MRKAPTEEAALASLDAAREHWAGEYPLAMGVWDRNWERIRTMFRFTEEIRRLIYITNPIESYHRQLRKVTKTRSLFLTDTAMLKLLYLATQEVLKKWTTKIRHWNQILAQLSIHFQERRGGVSMMPDCGGKNPYTKLLTHPYFLQSPLACFDLHSLHSSPDVGLVFLVSTFDPVG